MSLLTAQRRMLYCPKCSRTYEEGTQRFCSDDGVRLLARTAGGGAQPRNVFSNLLSRAQSPREEEEPKNIGAPSVKPEKKRRIFEPVDAFNPEKNIGGSKNEKSPATKVPPAKPEPRLIRPNEIPPSQAKLGDRTVEPGAGRATALTWENPEILLGQTIKGRYRILEHSSRDETSIAYLAEDKIVQGKKVVVRVLMEEADADAESGKIYAEERVSLSHVNHPNIASLLDSGALPEGKSFIVSEYVEGSTLKDMLRQTGTFNQLRAARIIRQAAHALSEAHVNGILHRSLRPEHIVLTVSETGKELVKVTDFAVFDGFDAPDEETIKYLAPEQLEGRLSNYASDIYSLAVIAYQMLTGRHPFNLSTAKELIKAQKDGLNLRPTNLRLDLPVQVDEILEKALSYKPGERYPKARDFGDAFYNALTAVAPWEQRAEKQGQEAKPLQKQAEPPPETAEKPKEKPAPKEKVSSPPVYETKIALAEITPPLARKKAASAEDKEVPFEKKKDSTENEASPDLAAAESKTIEEAKAPEKKKIGAAMEIKALKTTAQTSSQDLPWEKRSPEPLQQVTTSRFFLFALGLLLLGVATWIVWNYFSNRPVDLVYVPTANTQNSGATGENNPGAADPAGTLSHPEEPPVEIEAPPLPRKIMQPPHTVYFQSSRENVKGDLVRNFRGFSFYYPDDWVKNPTDTHFIDVARIGATGTPIEQFLVTYYESKGTFSADRENFPLLVEKSSQDLKGALGGNYTLVWQGETRINGDWKAYEMKFQREGVTKNGEKIKLWGRRLWIPAARPGIRSGFVVTMLATSLSPEVKSIDDLGVKGELAQVLETFEPVSLDAGY